MSYDVLIFIHLSSVVVMLGAGGGSAFYKFMADRSKNTEVIAHTNKIIVFSDYIFTTPAVIILPISGILLMLKTGYSLNEPWLFISIILYVIAGILWLIAVYLQIKMKKISLKVKEENGVLDGRYFVLFKYWIVLGVFSFLAVGLVFFLMVFKEI